MDHSIGYLGRFERDFADLGPALQRYTRVDGATAPVDERPPKLKGVWFGYMQKAAKEFVAVRAQYGDHDIFVKNPVRLDPPRHTDGKGFGPKPSRFGDTSAQNLLVDLVRNNPGQSDELERLAKAAGFFGITSLDDAPER